MKASSPSSSDTYLPCLYTRTHRNRPPFFGPTTPLPETFWQLWSNRQSTTTRCFTDTHLPLPLSPARVRLPRSHSEIMQTLFCQSEYSATSLSSVCVLVFTPFEYLQDKGSPCHRFFFYISSSPGDKIHCNKSTTMIVNWGALAFFPVSSPQCFRLWKQNTHFVLYIDSIFERARSFLSRVKPLLLISTPLNTVFLFCCFMCFQVVFWYALTHFNWFYWFILSHFMDILCSVNIVYWIGQTVDFCGRSVQKYWLIYQSKRCISVQNATIIKSIFQISFVCIDVTWTSFH